MFNGISSNIILEMRPCTLDDFTNNGYTQPMELVVEKLICPDVESYGAKYRLHNGYKTKIERVSVSLEVIACNDEFTNGCKSSEDIKLLLDNLVIT